MDIEKSQSHGHVAPPPYTIFSPQGNRVGIVFNSPHSGEYLPKSFLKLINIDPALLLYSGDMLVDRLIKDIPQSGATTFIQHYARIYVDSNRETNEIDEGMFDGNMRKYHCNRTEKVARGFGIFSSKSFNGKELFSNKLPESEITHRLETVYHPVHNAIRGLLSNFHDQFGYYIFIDCHSMPSYKFIDPNLSNATQPDLVIGNCFNKSCSKEFSKFVADFFSQQGLKISFNNPYSGGYNTQKYGQFHTNPLGHKFALQLEFNRALYMDENSLTPNEGFKSLQKTLTLFSKKLSQELRRFFPAEE